MKKNQGITFIALIITILVLVLITSFTIYDGIDTLQKAKKNDAMNVVQSVYLSLLIKEDEIPYMSQTLADFDTVLDYQFTDDDLVALGLSNENNFTITLNKSINGNELIYSFVYTDDKGHSYPPFVHTYSKEQASLNNTIEFDVARGVNRPVFPTYWGTNGKAIKYVNNASFEDVSNVYTEDWYSYNRNTAEIALAEYNDDIYLWIPRFAYWIQYQYDWLRADRVPATAIDIVFLKGTTDDMANGEPVDYNRYILPPAFENDVAGFWVMLKPKTASSFNNAITSARANGVSIDVAHLMNAGEYAAVAMLLKALNVEKYLLDGDVGFMPEDPIIEYTAATLDNTKNECENFTSEYDGDDPYSYENAQGFAFLETPWGYEEDELPEMNAGVFVRDLTKGYFYHETVGGTETGQYRRVIVIK